MCTLVGGGCGSKDSIGARCVTSNSVSNLISLVLRACTIVDYSRLGFGIPCTDHLCFGICRFYMAEFESFLRRVFFFLSCGFWLAVQGWICLVITGFVYYPKMTGFCPNTYHTRLYIPGPVSLP